MIDFFSYADAVPTQKEFAIHDDLNQQPVFIEYVGASEKQVIVISNNSSDYNFIAVDHKIHLKRDDGSDDNVCDAMLYTSNSLCFIEIKSQREDWIDKASKQVISTIVHFDNNHPNDIHRHREAYLCNWKRRYNLVDVSHKQLKNDFWQNYKTHLYISNTVRELV